MISLGKTLNIVDFVNKGGSCKAGGYTKLGKKGSKARKYSDSHSQGQYF